MMEESKNYENSRLIATADDIIIENKTNETHSMTLEEIKADNRRREIEMLRKYYEETGEDVPDEYKEVLFPRRR